MKKKYNLYLISLIILFALFIIYLIYSITKKEDFINNPNYCRSINGNFIYITDTNDSRCLRNKKLNNNKTYITGKGNCSKDGSWGLWYNNSCLNFQNMFNKFYGLNYNELLKQKKDKYFSEEEEDNNYYYKKLKKNEKIPKKKTCNDLRKKNSTPCFELFENSGTCSSDQLQTYQNAINDSQNTDSKINLDSGCQTSNGELYGYYNTECYTGENNNITTTNNCRKFYKSNNNQVISSDSTPLNGSYKPESYFYVPKKSDDSYNMTGCFEKSLDFNSICASVNNNQLFGAYKILNGENGNCYDDNGEPDPTKSNAFCSQNFYNERPTVLVQNGYSTKCLPLYSNFTEECKKIIENNDDFKINAFDINSYDCPPNRGRAKCLLQNK
jgi:hypothetical protein